MTGTEQRVATLVETLGPAERLLDLFVNFPDHLWHHRPGVIVGGKWKAARREEINSSNRVGDVIMTPRGPLQAAGPNVPAIVDSYRKFAEIWQMNNELAARFASYLMKETEWRDIKVLSAAFLLVQSRAGEPVFSEQSGKRKVLFFDDDFRAVGEAMLKRYEQKSKRIFSPKMILRAGELLRLPEIAEINRSLGFGHGHGRKPFLGRYPRAVYDWLEFREANPSLLEGLRKAGYTHTIRTLCRQVGYKPQTKRFFEVLGWKQSQHKQGHRTVGLTGLQLEKLSFEGLTEEQICQKIVDERLQWKQVVGALPATVGLTPAIFVALLGQLSDKDLVVLTPTVEALGLLEHEAIRTRWEAALKTQSDQRTRNIATNVRNKKLQQALTASADAAVTRAVEEASKDVILSVMFLIDVSGSMEGAIELSKEALAMIVQAFPPDRLAIAAFNTMGQVLKPKHHSGEGVKHMLRGLHAGGGTHHSAGLTAIVTSGFKVPEGSDLILFFVGDEAGESGQELAHTIERLGLRPAAIAHIVSVAGQRGTTVRDAAMALRLPYSEVNVDQLRDVYQVQRTLKAVLEAPALRKRDSLLERVLRYELIEKPY